MATLQGIKFKTVDEYILVLPAKTKKLLKELRKTIRQTAPDAEEVISYNMPAFKYHGMLVYYAAHKGHIGFYPGNASLISIFKDKLMEYKTSKGTIQFPYNKPIPILLVQKIVIQRVKENLLKALAKAEKENIKLKIKNKIAIK